MEEDITIEELTDAYAQLGIFPLPDRPFVFKRGSDGAHFIHAGFVGKLSIDFLVID